LLKVWNVHKGRKTWEAELGVNDLRGITEKFIELLLKDVHSA